MGIASPTFSLVQFEIPGGICTPADLTTMAVPPVDLMKGVVLSGRGPIWVFATLAHKFHPCAWVGTHDPRLGGAVVVQSHVSDINVGDVIEIPVH